MEQRGRAAGVAEQNRARKSAVAHDQLLADAARRLHVTDDLVAIGRGVHSHYREVDAHHLEPRRYLRAEVGRGGVRTGEPVREHARLLPQRRDQPVHEPAMLSALANREDVRMPDDGQVILDHQAALHRQAGLPRKRDARADARSDDQHVACQACCRP